MHPTRRCTSHPGRATRGITLIEQAIVLAVSAILVGLAIPSFEQVWQRRHLEGAAAQLETDLNLARGLAVARNEVVRMSFTADAAISCYVIHTGPAGSCSCVGDGAAACAAGSAALRVSRLDATRQPRLLSNSKSIAFDPTLGTVTPTATVRVRWDAGPAIHQIVNVMGRVRSCSPAPSLPGLAAC